MDAEAFIVALLDVLPGKEIRGRKRLQKLGFIAQVLGAPISARFFLHDFGPFSREIASAADMLTLVGELDENDIPIGATKKFVRVYKLNGTAHVAEPLSAGVAGAVDVLQRYSTVELEIASTILYFHQNESLPWPDAVSATTELKPTKSVPQVISRATDALAGVGLYEGRGAH